MQIVRYRSDTGWSNAYTDWDVDDTEWRTLAADNLPFKPSYKPWCSK